jgi:hypothetical protein
VKRPLIFSILNLNNRKNRYFVYAIENQIINFFVFLNRIKFLKPSIFRYSDYLNLIPIDELESSKRSGGKGHVQFNKLFDVNNSGVKKRIDRDFPTKNFLIDKLNIGEGTKICAFYFREKNNPGLKDSDIDQANFIRNSRSVDDFLPTFQFLNSIGVRILWYGEKPRNLHVKLIGLDILTSDQIGVDEKIWNLWVPVISDFVIAGSNGGGLLPGVKFQKRILILDAFDYSFGLPNSLHAFKLIFCPKVGHISPLHYLVSCPWDRSFLNNCDIKNVPKDLILVIVREFLSYLISWPEADEFKIHIHPDSLLAHAPNALISKKYLEYSNRLIEHNQQNL